jgi:hypothetical protein
MQENGTVWCPTLSTVGNLRGRGRFDESAVSAIYESALANVRAFSSLGGSVAPGSDAGAWAVPHGQGSLDEYNHLRAALGQDADACIARGIQAIRDKF